MSAVISGCGRYRYRLERGTHGDALRTVAFIMVNPSTTDHSVDDQTIRKVRTFAAITGHGRLIVGNLFAWRATDIKALRTANFPIGPDNDRHLTEIMGEADTVIVAWGTSGKLPRTLRRRWQDIVNLADAAGKSLHCLGIAADGHPLHPLMLGYDRPVVPWSAPASLAPTAVEEG